MSEILGELAGFVILVVITFGTPWGRRWVTRMRQRAARRRPSTWQFSGPVEAVAAGVIIFMGIGALVGSLSGLEVNLRRLAGWALRGLAFALLAYFVFRLPPDDVE